jgi:hypothetical protein
MCHPSETESRLHPPRTIGFDSVTWVRENTTEGEARGAEPYIRVRIPSSPPNTEKKPRICGAFSFTPQRQTNAGAEMIQAARVKL